MNILQYVSIRLTLFLLAGIVLGYYWDPPMEAVLLLLLTILALLATLLYRNPRKPDLSFGVLAMLFSCCLGILLISLDNSFDFRKQLKQEALERPHLWSLKIREILKPSPFYERYIATVLSVDSTASGGKVLCRIPLGESNRSLAVDDQIWVYARVDEIARPHNPYQFDYKKYMAGMGIHREIRVDPENTVVEIASSRSVLGWADMLRNWVLDELDKLNFGTDERTIFQALTLGYKDEISTTIHDRYRKAGALHILAVSGLHIGIVLLILQSLLKPLELLPRGRDLKMILILILLWCYALIAGFSPSVIRAVTMFSFLAYSQYIKRPGTTFNILAIAMAFSLIFIDPLMLFQPGFQLSYAAVFSIVWLYPKLMKLWQPGNLIIKKLWQLSSVSIAAQVGILPIGLYYFHQFPGLFLLTNMLIVPFLGIILSLGFITIILVIIGFLPEVLIRAYDLILQTMNRLIAWVSSQEFFHIEHIYFDTGHLILSCTGILAFIGMISKPVPVRIYLCFVLLLGLQLWDAVSLIRHRSNRQLSILHTIGNTVVFYQNGGVLKVYSGGNLVYNQMLTDYVTGERISEIKYDTLRNIYNIKNESILVIDERLATIAARLNSDLVLLSGSPRFNLDRYLQNVCPKLLIFDGSNYKSYVARWRRSCERMGIPFHDTAKEGAYVMIVK